MFYGFVPKKAPLSLRERVKRALKNEGPARERRADECGAPSYIYEAT